MTNIGMSPNLEPEDFWCSWCKGYGRVEVASVYGADGKVFQIPDNKGEDIACPRCKGGLDESDPGDPRVDDQIKARRAYGVACTVPPEMQL